jgi:4-hydroxybenzoate polyprenyltransferase
MLISAIVLFWVGGFDIIYALPDEEFDRREGLFSIPARFGCRGALIFSAALHAIAAGLVVAAGLALSAGALYAAGATLFCGLLLYQHLIVKPTDLSRVDAAFATTNGVASMVFGGFAIIDLLL